MKSYQEILDYLFSQLPMYQRSGTIAYKNTLGNTLFLDELYEHPHHYFKSIHIAGTNGKGSASHILASVLQEAGYKVGLYTSPHLIDFRERIRVNGEVISEDYVIDFVEKFQTLNERANLEPSFFEVTVAMAFEYFKHEKVEVAVIEVGLGGRLDSTNIITPELSLITNISLDHTALLGNSISLIAAEKAGIIKPKVPVVISESDEKYNQVFEKKASLNESPIFFADQEYDAAYSMLLPGGQQLFNFNKSHKPAFPDLKTDLMGIYQKKNIGGVLKAIEILQNQNWSIKQEHIYQGIANVKNNTGLRGRWEIVGNNPLVVCDTGHNVAGIKMVVEQIRNTAWKNLHVVLGMVDDKNIAPVLSLFPHEGHYYFTQANIPRALDAEILKEKAEASGLKGKVIKNVKDAVNEALQNAKKNDLILIGGSTFVVADFFS